MGAFVVLHGKLRYDQSPTSCKVQNNIAVMVHEKSWLCEAALWSHWIHVGTLTAETECTLMVISAESLWQILQKYREIGVETSGYCVNFHSRIVAAGPPHALWPTDICVQPQLDQHELLNEQVGI